MHCGFLILKAVRHWVIDAVRYWEVTQRDIETARQWVVIDKCFAQEAQSWELRAVRGVVSTMQRRSPPWRWGLSFARWVNCMSPTRSNSTERPCCKQCDQVWDHRKGSCEGTCRCSPNGARHGWGALRWGKGQMHCAPNHWLRWASLGK